MSELESIQKRFLSCLCMQYKQHVKWIKIYQPTNQPTNQPSLPNQVVFFFGFSSWKPWRDRCHRSFQIQRRRPRKITKALIYIPRTQLTPIFKGQPPKRRPFPFKTRVIWVPGIYSSIYLHIDDKDEIQL